MGPLATFIVRGRAPRLRADLYYRLNVFTIHLPPLRERLEDMPQLIQMFIEQYAVQNHKDVIGADEECVKALQANPWRGNVRQLRNVIERAVIICEVKWRAQGECAAISRSPNPIDERAVRVSPGHGQFIHGKKESARRPRFAQSNCHVRKKLGQFIADPHYLEITNSPRERRPFSIRSNVTKNSCVKDHQCGIMRSLRDKPGKISAQVPLKNWWWVSADDLNRCTE